MNNLLISVEGLPSQQKEQVLNVLQTLAEGSEDEYLFTEARDYIQSPEEVVVSDARLTLLHDTLSRRHHILEAIDPALRAGKMVVCRDWLAATYAYIHFVIEQGPDLYFSDIVSEIFNLHDTYCQGLYPELSFYVHATPEESYDYLQEQAFSGFFSVSVEVLTAYEKGYLDFGTLCAEYIDAETTPHFMGATKWIEIDASDPMRLLDTEITEARRKPVSEVSDPDDSDQTHFEEE